MIKYIDKAAIENILHKLWKTDKWYGLIDVARTSYNQALQEVQCELDALAIEEIDLDDEIHNYINIHYSEGCDGGMISDAHNDIGGVTYSDLATIAEHFYELGRQRSNKSQEGK